MLLIVHILNPALMVFIPLALGVWLVRRWKLDWAVFGFGSLTFVASQVLHIPFNLFLLNPLLEQLGGEGWAWVAVALLLGLSSGLFEEIARYVMLKRASSRVRDWTEGVLYGLGHGGAEAIYVGVLALYALIQVLALRGVALESVLPPEQLETARIQLESYWGMAWYEPLWATLERLSALAFHTMAALFVLMAVRRNRPVWLVAAILAHTLFNAVALLAIKALGVAAMELILAGIGLFCLWVVFRARSGLTFEMEAQERGETSSVAPQSKEIASEIEAERLDESKYV